MEVRYPDVQRLQELVDEIKARVVTKQTGNLFRAGDVEALARKLREPIPVVPIGEWTAEGAAEALLRLVAESSRQNVRAPAK